MQRLNITASPAQLRKLKKGLPVNLKHAMEGTGVGIMVDPGKFSVISKIFNNGRGARVKLSDEEISANIEGGSLNARRAKGGSLNAKQAKGTGLTSSSDRAPVKSRAKKAFQEPYEAQEPPTNIGGPKAILTPSTISGVFDQSELFKQINGSLGTSFGNLQSATIGNAASAFQQAGVDTDLIDSKATDQVIGTGLWANHREGGSIGMNGGFVHRQPQALSSQPYATNFQFQHTLPIAYQRFSGGGGLPC